MKSLRLVLAEGVRGQGLRRPHHVGRDVRTLGPDRRRRHQAVVRWHRVRWRDRLARDRLARADRPPSVRWRRLRQVGLARGQVRLARDHQGDGHHRRLDEERQLRQRRHRQRRRPSPPRPSRTAGKPILARQVRHATSRRRSTPRSGPTFKKDAKIAEDGDVFAFYLPPIDAAFPKPVVGGGEFVTAFSDVPRSRPSRPTCRRPTFANAQVQAGRLGLGQQRCRRWTNYTGPDREAVGAVPDRPDRRRSASTLRTSCRLLSVRVPSGSR